MEDAYIMFGEIGENRVTIYSKKGWFNKGSREDLPLKHITSVKIEIEREIIKGLLFCLLGVFLLPIGLIGLPVIFLAICLIWGYPKISVNTAGGDRNEMEGFPWQKKQAEVFVKKLRERLF